MRLHRSRISLPKRRPSSPVFGASDRSSGRKACASSAARVAALASTRTCVPCARPRRGDPSCQSDTRSRQRGHNRPIPSCSPRRLVSALLGRLNRRSRRLVPGGVKPATVLSAVIGHQRRHKGVVFGTLSSCCDICFSSAAQHRSSYFAMRQQRAGASVIDEPAERARE